MILPDVLYLSGNLIPCPKGRMEIQVLENRGTGVSIWIKERGSNRHLEKTSAGEFHNGTPHKYTFLG